jgi:hypothetical protein
MQQVTVENFIRVLTGRLPPSTPSSKRLLSDERSNVLIYMTGLFSFHNALYEAKRVNKGKLFLVVRSQRYSET